MKRVLNALWAPGAAAWACWTAALGAVGLAFIGAERAGALMAQPPFLTLTTLLVLWSAVVGGHAMWRRRLAAALLHLGCACVMAGWLIGRIAERRATPDHPVSGAMAMIDGDVSDRLWQGAYLTNYVGRVPFTVTLEKFLVERYPRSRVDEEAGRAAPVREYRSRIKITQSGENPYVVNVRVNQPAFVQGYHIYQMSWGQSQDHFGRPVTYTVLQFVRDPGLRLVYVGFVLLFVGILFFAVRLFRLKLSGAEDQEVRR